MDYAIVQLKFELLRLELASQLKRQYFSPTYFRTAMVRGSCEFHWQTKEKNKN